MTESGSRAVVCASCRRLVSAGEAVCPFCGARRSSGGGIDALLRAFFELPWSHVVVAGSALLFVVALLLDPGNVGSHGMLGLLVPSGKAQLLLGASGALPVFGFGRFSTVLSALWLHGGLLHILFNMLWVRQLAPLVASGYGGARTALIYLLSGAAGFALSSTMGWLLPGLPGFLRGATVTVGASGAVFGLLGAVVYFGRRHGHRAIASQVWTWALVLFLFGVVFPGVDNYAHLGGFAGGWLTGRLLDRPTREGAGTRLAAFLLLLASLGAVGLSYLRGYDLPGF